MDTLHGLRGYSELVELLFVMGPFTHFLSPVSPVANPYGQRSGVGDSLAMGKLAFQFLEATPVT
jgi:hypothetical protein